VPVANGRILASPDARLLTIDDGHLFRVTSAGIRGRSDRLVIYRSRLCRGALELTHELVQASRLGRID
jgi:hypothetical protein